MIIYIALLGSVIAGYMFAGPTMAAILAVQAVCIAINTGAIGYLMKGMKLFGEGAKDLADAFKQQSMSGGPDLNELLSIPDKIVIKDTETGETHTFNSPEEMFKWLETEAPSELAEGIKEVMPEEETKH